MVNGARRRAVVSGWERGRGRAKVGEARHTRSRGRAGLRRARLRYMSVTMLVMLVIQYGLGIILNLYVEVPAADAHAGILTEIATAPAVLTIHAVLGVTLIGTGIILVARAARVRDRLLAGLATAGPTPLRGAVCGP